LKEVQLDRNAKVTLLGSNKKVACMINDDGTITIQPPESDEGLSAYANVYKITNSVFVKSKLLEKSD